MRIFARDAVLARSKFWYHCKRQHKIRRIQGEIVNTSEVSEPDCAFNWSVCRFSRRRLAPSGTTELWSATWQEPSSPTCTRSTETRHFAELSLRCTWRWLEDTVPTKSPFKSSEPQLWATRIWEDLRFNSSPRTTSSQRRSTSSAHLPNLLVQPSRLLDLPFAEQSAEECHRL